MLKQFLMFLFHIQKLALYTIYLCCISLNETKINPIKAALEIIEKNKVEYTITIKSKVEYTITVKNKN